MSTPPRKIETKIVSFQVNSPEPETKAPLTPAEPDIQHMNEAVARGGVLAGRTYKIEKSASSEHAIYVTINDIVLNEGTAHEQRRPFEIFINSKNMDQFQWVVAMTRIMSAVFRKGGDIKFLVEEMKSVFDPHGGYFRPGGYVPSLVAEIGMTVEKHLQHTGVMSKPEPDAAVAAMIEKKKAELAGSSESTGFPAGASQCPKCHQHALILMDGCQTCLSCGHSKCG